MGDYNVSSVMRLMHIQREVPEEVLAKLSPDEYMEMLKDERSFTTPLMAEIIEKYLMDSDDFDCYEGGEEEDSEEK